MVNALEYPGDLRDLTDPRDGPARLVYGPHLYDSTLDVGGGFDAATNDYVATWASLRTADANAWGMSRCGSASTARVTWMASRPTWTRS